MPKKDPMSEQLAQLTQLMQIANAGLPAQEMQQKAEANQLDAALRVMGIQQAADEMSNRQRLAEAQMRQQRELSVLDFLNERLRGAANGFNNEGVPVQPIYNMIAKVLPEWGEQLRLSDPATNGQREAKAGQTANMLYNAGQREQAKMILDAQPDHIRQAMLAQYPELAAAAASGSPEMPPRELPLSALGIPTLPPGKAKMYGFDQQKK